jgi:nitrite reductase/ring-hydroxylating ferredoxin subunit
MPEPLPSTPLNETPQRICGGDELAERGDGVRFDVLYFRERVNAFVLRFDGAVVGYLNRCAHVPTELDWQAGKFLDLDREYILCAVHGAAYEPTSGRCAGGPCGTSRLTPLRVEERSDGVYWYPSRDIQPAP